MQNFFYFYLNLQFVKNDKMNDGAEKQFIKIKGARSHNLQNIDVNIPRNCICVITGPSGSGKSSLAFNTLFAEGQRRYVESLSAYARQFLEKMPPPDVDSIEGIPPAIAIEQKVGTRQSSSTVGTSTEIYDYLKLLFARIGRTFSPVSGEEVKQHTEKDVVDFVFTQKEQSSIYILTKIDLSNGRNLSTQLEIYHSQGYGRLMADNKPLKFDLETDCSVFENAQSIWLVIDRFVLDLTDNELKSRVADSAYMGFHEGNGELVVHVEDAHDGSIMHTGFSNKFEADGIVFEKPDVRLFSFNNPYGACRKCEGYGTVLGIDKDLVIPDKSLSLLEDAVVCWKGEKLSEWKQHFIRRAHEYDFPVHTPINQLTTEQFDLLWNGNRKVYGIKAFFEYVESKAYKIQYRVILSRYRGRTICPECRGTRIRKEAQYIKVCNHTIVDLVTMPVDELADFFLNICLNSFEQKASERILTEIRNRIDYLSKVGLHYLTLNRASNTLSGGETQRINLAQSVGSNLVGSLYIIDEPTIGLHPKDTHRLLETIRHLKELGNTIVIVEHEEEIIKAADYIIDMGPLAGTAGGEVVFAGTFEELLKNGKTLTASYFRNEMVIPIPTVRRKWRNFIEIIGASEHNLQNIDLKIPLGIFTVITGPSGSGKSTLVKKILVPALRQRLSGTHDKPGKCKSVGGDSHLLNGVEFIDQNPVGRSSRSNPATYTKAFDDIRQLFSMQPLAKMRNYKPGFFSFNTKGGRCETCSGDGFIMVEMQFLADVELVCETCNGKRYTEEALEVSFMEKTVTDILDMTVTDALSFFEQHLNTKFAAVIRSACEKIRPLQEIGLGYLRLGQPTSTLSGGEIQRLKLATYLIKGNYEKPLLFVFDEPSTGLHYYDIQKLHIAFESLIAKGHSLLVIEHNMELIKSADWIIDLGPEGGKNGGKLMFEGTPEDMIANCTSFTADFLKEKFSNKKL